MEISQCLLTWMGLMTNFSACVAEDNGLRDGKCVVKVAKCIELPILFLHGNEKLFDTLKGQLVTLDKYADRVGHEFCRHF